jgi:16S rRNA U516 pseudouridylate synthase RsuA-like enzyme
LSAQNQRLKNIGHQTLRLVCVWIGKFQPGDLPPGQWRILSAKERKQL